MNIALPPLFFYAVGSLLVVFGVLRAVVLGRRRGGAADGEGGELVEDTPARLRTRRRHLAFGIVWVVMGLFLIISTAGVLKMRSGL
jgi:hypothetical protein